MSDSFVLDSYAVFALIQREAGSKRVLELLHQAREGEHILLMSLINLGEVAYHVERRFGVEAVHRLIIQIERAPIQLAGVNRSTVLAAAHLKANHAIAYADAFAAALAQEHNATLVTGDPEFRLLEKVLRIEWLS